VLNVFSAPRLLASHLQGAFTQVFYLVVSVR